MLVVDLHCGHGHHFEGWFASADDLSSQKERGLLTCPVCGDRDVSRRPSAPHLNTLGLKATREGKASAEPVLSAASQQVDPSVEQVSAETIQHLQSLYLQTVRQMISRSEDVGDRFADEARSMHHGVVPERPIRGQATPEEKEALREEGIDVLSLAIPDGLKGTLQ